MVERDREVWGQYDTGRDVERDQQGVGYIQRHEGWMQRWKEPRHGKRDKETDKSVRRETETHRDRGRRHGETESDRHRHSHKFRNMGSGP